MSEIIAVETTVVSTGNMVESEKMDATTETSKRCDVCNIDLLLSRFWKDKTKPDGLDHCCIACKSLWQKQHRAKQESKEKQRGYRRKWEEKHRNERIESRAKEVAIERNVKEQIVQMRQAKEASKRIRKCCDCSTVFVSKAAQITVSGMR